MTFETHWSKLQAKILMRISWNNTFALHMATNLNIWIFGHSIDQNPDNWKWHWTAFAILAMFGWWLPIEVDQWSMTTSVLTSNCMILMGVGHPKLGKFYICDMCAFCCKLLLNMSLPPKPAPRCFLMHHFDVVSTWEVGISNYIESCEIFFL